MFIFLQQGRCFLLVVFLCLYLLNQELFQIELIFLNAYFLFFCPLFKQRWDIIYSLCQSSFSNFLRVWIACYRSYDISQPFSLLFFAFFRNFFLTFKPGKQPSADRLASICSSSICSLYVYLLFCILQEMFCHLAGLPSLEFLFSPELYCF